MGLEQSSPKTPLSSRTARRSHKGRKTKAKCHGVATNRPLLLSYGRIQRSRAEVCFSLSPSSQVRSPTIHPQNELRLTCRQAHSARRLPLIESSCTAQSQGEKQAQQRVLYLAAFRKQTHDHIDNFPSRTLYAGSGTKRDAITWQRFISLCSVGP